LDGGRLSAPLRVLVVDDEPLARQLVRLLLARDAEVTVVGECSGDAAAALVASARPDILFLDVQMPEVDGFALLEQLGPACPVVVFLTAYDRYAVRAFDVHAVDYLLKPVDDARFAAALARAKTAARARPAGAADERISALLRDHARHARRFLVRTRDRTIVVDASAIDWIEAADYYVSLHVGGRAHLLRETMAELEQRLDPDRFLRVHRSAIVNLERVREIHPLFRGDCELLLESGARVRLSRTRRAEFDRLFAGPARGRSKAARDGS
jgi:two-component system LytT family response regulator